MLVVVLLEPQSIYESRMMKQDIMVMLKHSDISIMYLYIDMLTLSNVHYVTSVLIFCIP